MSCSVVEQSCVLSAITLQEFGIDVAQTDYFVLNPWRCVLSITGSMIQMVFEFWIIFGFPVNKQEEIPFFISFRRIPVTS